MQKIEKGTFKINVANDDQYYSQRNNNYIHKNSKGVVDASGVTQCNASSIIMAADINGWKFPKGKYSQPEDNLMDFIFSSKEVDDYYAKTMPVLYKDYKEETLDEKGKPTYYTPNEVHAVLAFAFNKWIQSNADTFSENCQLSTIINELLEDRSVVISGKFAGFSHIVALVGATWKFAENIESKSPYSLISKIKNEHLKPNTFIINDPYGDYKDYKNIQCGRNIEIPFDDFIQMIKPLGNYSIKMAHLIKSGAAII